MPNDARCQKRISPDDTSAVSRETLVFQERRARISALRVPKPMASRIEHPTIKRIRDLQALRRFLGPYRPERRQGSRLRALAWPLPKVFRHD